MPIPQAEPDAPSRLTEEEIAALRDDARRMSEIRRKRLLQGRYSRQAPDNWYGQHL
jgi:hypothetical protein